MGDAPSTVKKNAFLGLPSHGLVSAASALGTFQAIQGGGGLHLAIRTVEGSLLANGFNRLWCEALNLAKGPGLDYFAMIHADVEPEVGWLDILVAELEAKNLDVLGAVVPIKDVRGMTSIALARDDGDPWRIHCRLTMSEVYRLPETFTSDDVGKPLLLNTGLWVCRMGDWCKRMLFTINDRICIDPETGDYYPQVEPEDWYFSRHLHALGLKVGCTRKVRLNHRGPTAYGNVRPWGNNTFDHEYVSRSVLDPDLGDDWFPHRAAGWLTEPEGRELARIAEDKAVLEIGSYCGRSTICLARTAKCVTAVDTFDGRGTACDGDTLGTFTANLALYGVADKVNAIRGESATVLPDLPPVYDVVFIDGGHDLPTVTRDAELALGRLKPGGVLAFHDYQSGRGDEGVTQAVDAMLAGGAELLSRADSLAVLRPAPRREPETVHPVGA